MHPMNIHYIVLHCTAIPSETIIEHIKEYWKKQLHWKHPGYHYIIRKRGEIEKLCLQQKISSRVRRYKTNSIHISYVGSDGNNGCLAACTKRQIEAITYKLRELKHENPKAMIVGQQLPELLNAA